MPMNGIWTSIAEGRALRYRRFTGRLSCGSGRLWLTWPGSGDLLLGRGEEYSSDRSKDIVIQALGGPASFSLSSSARAPGEEKRPEALERLPARVMP